MKKILISALALAMVAGMTSSALSAEFNNASGGTATTTVLGGTNFTPSTNVALDAIATTVAWAASAKHEAGGTIEYGMEHEDSEMTTTTGRAEDDAVTDQTDADTLQTP